MDGREGGFLGGVLIKRLSQQASLLPPGPDKCLAANFSLMRT